MRNRWTILSFNVKMLAYSSILSLGYYSAPFEVPLGALDIRPFLKLEPKFYGRCFLLASGGEYLRNINGRIFQGKRAHLA